jgi:hypothetical protein
LLVLRWSGLGSGKGRRKTRCVGLFLVSNVFQMARLGLGFFQARCVWCVCTSWARSPVIPSIPRTHHRSLARIDKDKDESRACLSVQTFFSFYRLLLGWESIDVSCSREPLRVGLFRFSGARFVLWSCSFLDRLLPLES